jgi:hypothetical protein
MRNLSPTANTPENTDGINAQEILACGKVDIEKLARIVNESIKAFSVTANLTQNKVVDILGNIRVEMLEEVQEAVESLKGIEGVDRVSLSVAIEETLRAIEATTNLDADEITRILTEKRGASVEDIVKRLHEKSWAARQCYA